MLDRKGERFEEVYEENQRRVWVFAYGGLLPKSDEMKASKRACCCRLFMPAGRVASFLRVRCMRSWRPFCCGRPGLMRSIAMPRRRAWRG